MFLDTYMKFVIERGFFETVRIVLDRALKIFHIFIGRSFYRIKKNKIVFLTFSGAYDCNPKWIAEEMLKRGIDAEYVWGLTDKTKVGAGLFPPQMKLVKRDTFAFYKQLFTAKVIIDNGISTSYNLYSVKKGQVLIETWHGSLGIKRFDAGSNKNKRWVKKAKKEGKMTSYIISNSSFEDNVYRDSFWKNKTIWRYGHARNDILINPQRVDIYLLEDKFREKYNISKDSKLCLYAPTFRDDNDISPYVLNYEKLQDALSLRFGGEWTIIVRFHPRIRDLLAGYVFPKFVVNVSDYVDIQEILCFISVGITDYSSWICEYVLTRKPGFIFATDADNYEKKDRKLFFPLTYMPFPVAFDQTVLIDNIKSFDNEVYIQECDRFLNEMGSVDDGHASERIVDEIEKIIEK